MPAATSVLMADPDRGGRPRVVLLLADGAILAPLLSFFRGESLSRASEVAYAYALGRFLNWLQVRGMEFNGEHRAEALKAFAEDLLWGTVCNKDGEVSDPTGLWWRSTSIANVNQALRRITQFSDWYADKYGTVPLNPERPLATAAEQIRYWAAWGHRKRMSLLGHLKSAKHDGNKARWVREVKGIGKPLVGLNDAKAFPEELIDPLLTKAFLVNPHARKLHERYNLRDLAITALCLFGGLRISEAMHLWATDIPSAPEDPMDEPLWISHPSQGYVRHLDERTHNIVRMKRADYLQRICGKRPLTEEIGRKRAGWKSALLHDKARNAFRVFWLDPVGAELFYACWAGYLKTRPLVLRTPWAWLTKEGDPVGVASFEESWSVAMRRIGVTPNKIAGTTPHGLRHRYGRWFNDLPLNDEFKQKLAQICLHHQIESPQVV